MVSSDASLLRRRDDKKLTAVPQTLEQSLLNPSSRATAMSERMEEGSAVRDSSERKSAGGEEERRKLTLRREHVSLRNLANLHSLLQLRNPLRKNSMGKEVEKVRFGDERCSQKLFVEPDRDEEDERSHRSDVRQRRVAKKGWFERCTHQANPASLNSKLNQILTVPSISSRKRHSPPSSGLMNSGSGWEMKPSSSLQQHTTTRRTESGISRRERKRELARRKTHSTISSSEFSSSGASSSTFFSRGFEI